MAGPPSPRIPATDAEEPLIITRSTIREPILRCCLWATSGATTPVRMSMAPMPVPTTHPVSQSTRPLGSKSKGSPESRQHSMAARAAYSMIGLRTRLRGGGRRSSRSLESIAGMPPTWHPRPSSAASGQKRMPERPSRKATSNSGTPDAPGAMTPIPVTTTRSSMWYPRRQFFGRTPEQKKSVASGQTNNERQIGKACPQKQPSSPARATLFVLRHNNLNALRKRPAPGAPRITNDILASPS